MAWHRHGWAGAVIRLGGAMLLGIAYLAGARLFAAPSARPDALFALILFTSGCAGSAMLVLGAHLFDQVEVSRRWSPIPSPLRRQGPMSLAANDVGETRDMGPCLRRGDGQI